MSRQHFLFPLFFLSLSLLLFSCGSTRPLVPSQIGLLPLEGYSYRYAPGEGEPDTLFRVIRDEALFNASFVASNAGVRRPAFSGQTVVALVMRSVPATALHFSRAAVVGKQINVYAQPCAACTKSNVVAATIPNVGHAQTVRFYIDGESRASLAL